MRSFGKTVALGSVGMALAASTLLAACTPKPSSDEVASSQSSESAAMSITAAEAAQHAVSSAMSSFDATGYVGKWTGPEGTSLTITPSGTPAGSEYEVVIQNLDGPRTFKGTLEGDGIHITRDGAPLVIHKGNGAATGMKWLAEKTDCLVVAANEGYCKG
ncbi:hypothetical protein [Asticcacaulis sp. 201]|uniref:hypothetical protein n=1 Tax=Asticcacaulis sp. 201 TaxID=3028787 RepID=UPI00291605D3|nr:hypothetical protein [Asticcacaulis sp. 201]MDV6329851.1 hypothetical protein [Asticcacaulis sp. 201]